MAVQQQRRPGGIVAGQRIERVVGKAFGVVLGQQIKRIYGCELDCSPA